MAGSLAFESDLLAEYFEKDSANIHSRILLVLEALRAKTTGSTLGFRDGF